MARPIISGICGTTAFPSALSRCDLLGTAKAGLVTSTVVEGVLQSTQVIWTPTEGAVNIAMATVLSGVLGSSVGAVRQAVEVRNLGKLHDKVATPNADGTLGGGGGEVNIGLGDLEKGLKNIKFDEGSGILRSDGTARAKPRHGMVKIVWKHGAQSQNASELGNITRMVTRDDVMALPSIARNYQAITSGATLPKGEGEWSWVVDRPGANGTSRPILYSVKRFSNGDGLDHIVTVHVLDNADNITLSKKRGLFGGNRNGGTESSSEIVRPLGDTAKSSLDRNNQGQPPPPNGSVAQAGQKTTQPTAWDDLQARVVQDLNNQIEPGQIKVTENDLVQGTDSTAGAAQVKRGDEKIKSALGVEKALKYSSPMMRTAQSESVETRRIVQDFIETPFYYEKNGEGIATEISVETLVRRWDANLADGTVGLEQAFVAHRRGGGKGKAAKIAASDKLPGGVERRGQKLTWQDFRSAVGHAMRNGDEHPVKEVADAARHLRKAVFDPLKDAAIEKGLLPADVDVSTATSYLMRVYDVDKIIRQRPEFTKRVTEWLVSQRDGAEGRLLDFEGRLKKREDRTGIQATKLETAKNDMQSSHAEWKRQHGLASSAQRSLSVANREARTAEALQNQAQKRAKTFKPTAEFRKTDPLAQAVKDMRSRGKTKTQSLSSWLVSKGGLRESGGELAFMDIKPKTRPGLLNNKSGMNFDDAALRAWEQGFFPGFSERPTINDFLSALHDDVNGSPVFRADDLNHLDYQAYLADLEKNISQLGLDPLKATPAEIQAAFDAPNGQLANSKYRKATPQARAKFRELEFQLRHADERLAKARQRQSDALAKHKEALNSHTTARSSASEARHKFNALDDAARRAARKRDALQKLVNDERAFAGADNLELRDIAEQITNTVTGVPEGRIPYETVQLAVKGPLKERTFSIPDTMIQDFLISDVEDVMTRYVHTMAPDVELAGKFVTPDMKDVISKITDDYVRKINLATSERQRTRLDKAMKADVRDVEAMRDRLRGTYGRPANPYAPAVRILRGVRDWNYLRNLGGMTISAIPDIARPVMVHGFMRTFKAGVVPLVTNLRALKLAGNEAKMAGTALDMVLNSRANNLMELGHNFNRNTKLESGLRGLTDNFSMISLMSPWNAAIKQFTGAISGTRILQESGNWMSGRIKKANREDLAMLGIDQGMAARIADQFKKFGTKEGGLWIAGTKNWTDGAAVETFRAALAKDIDMIIVTPGAGDRPLWMSSELGKTIGQFKSFSVSSSQRVLLAGLQKRDASTMMGAAMMMGLGMGVYAIKSMLGGYATSDKPQVWIAEGVDRSGLMGWFFDVNNIAERTLGIGVNRAIGGRVPSRYAQRNTLGTLLGPSAGTAQDVFKAAQTFTNGSNLTASDIHTWRRLAPYQNLFYMRSLFDQTEQGLGETLGVKRKR